MKRLTRTDEDGMMGIEAAIILITAIVTASVLAGGVLLHMGYFSAEKTRSVAYEGVGQVGGTTVVTLGSIHGVERGGESGCLTGDLCHPGGQ
ncbi:hypothetical protein [Methanogenium cariaci]|uniref:hypothetical protein n=1 Tax=Methanogenium cariaci TaxID=2197 RepID=UPI0007818185|nr:hypothetical protein [Methanogenium cariaci]